MDNMVAEEMDYMEEKKHVQSGRRADHIWIGRTVFGWVNGTAMLYKWVNCVTTALKRISNKLQGKESMHLKTGFDQSRRYSSENSRRKTEDQVFWGPKYNFVTVIQCITIV